MTVGEMLSRMTSSELTAWMIFNEYEPFGHPYEESNQLKEDYRSASEVAMMYNLKVPKKDRKDADHFLANWTGESRKKGTKQTSNKKLGQQIMMLERIFNRKKK